MGKVFQEKSAMRNHLWELIWGNRMELNIELSQMGACSCVAVYLANA